MKKSKYSYMLNTPEQRYYEVYIEADSNDADYISEVRTYLEDKFDNDIIDELIDLKNNHSGRHGLDDFFPEKITIPSTDWGMCHTLICLKVTMYDTDGKNYNIIIGE